MRPRTRAFYRHLLDGHVLPGLGCVRLNGLTPSAVREWHAALPGETVPAKCYRLLRAIMTTAVEDGLVGQNPCRIKGAGIEHSSQRPLPSGDEVWALAGAIEDRDRALVLVAAFVGLRWGELIGICRGDVDLAARTIHVTRQIVEVDGRLQGGPPKTAAGVRSVAMPPAVAMEMVVHLERFVRLEADALVFVGPKGATARRANFSVIWNRARVQVGRPDLHLHDLRHFANVLAASAGASTRELISRLGHASPAAALISREGPASRELRALRGG